jgi:hypothetical protein
MLAKTRNNDAYHQAFFYAMASQRKQGGTSIAFLFQEGGNKAGGLAAPWQTGGTRRLCRLAFNLWNGLTEEGKERFSVPTSFLIVALPPTLKPSGCAIPNICRSTERSAPCFSEKTR